MADSEQKTPAGCITLDDGPTGTQVERRPGEALTIVHHYPATVLHVVEPGGRVYHVETPGAARAAEALLLLKQEFAQDETRVGFRRRR